MATQQDTSSTATRPPITTKYIDLPALPGPEEIVRLLKQYGCGPVPFAGADNGLYERHMLFDNVKGLNRSGPRELFEAIEL